MNSYCQLCGYLCEVCGKWHDDNDKLFVTHYDDNFPPPEFYYVDGGDSQAEVIVTTSE